MLLPDVSGLQSALNGKQMADEGLTAIATLAGTSGFLKKTAANTWALDTNTYLAGNQSITVSGDASGTGTTAISLTLANSGATSGTYRSVTVDSKGLLVDIPLLTTMALRAIGEYATYYGFDLSKKERFYMLFVLSLGCSLDDG